jgi:hypothetical protein
VGWAVILSLAFVPPARTWILDQATHHVIVLAGLDVPVLIV